MEEVDDVIVLEATTIASRGRKRKSVADDLLDIHQCFHWKGSHANRIILLSGQKFFSQCVHSFVSNEIDYYPLIAREPDSNMMTCTICHH
jgi:hypothetical protein